MLRYISNTKYNKLENGTNGKVSKNDTFSILGFWVVVGGSERGFKFGVEGVENLTSVCHCYLLFCLCHYYLYITTHAIFYGAILSKIHIEYITPIIIFLHVHLAVYEEYSAICQSQYQNQIKF